MNAALQKAQGDYSGQDIIEYLEETLGNSSTMVAALIQVTVRTLDNWKNQNVSELTGNSKSKRLMRLYDFIRMAEDKRIKKRLMLNLLHEPIDPSQDESESILYFMVHEDRDELLRRVYSLVIERFMKDTKL